MKKINVGILGATGAVGREILKVLEQRDFPVGKIFLFASEKEVGTLLHFKGKPIAVVAAGKDAFSRCDVVFGAVDSAIAKMYAKEIVSCGAIFIDNSSAFRCEKDVPLVVPEINAGDIFTHKGIISNPNCSTIITLVALNAINKLSTITQIYACTYQAVSGAGAAGLCELREQMEAKICKKSPKSSVFEEQILENVLPKIGEFTENGFTDEEMKMQNEGRKILHNDELLVNCTCVRVPVERSHSIAVSVRTNDKLDLQQVKSALKAEKGVVFVETPAYPTPLKSSFLDDVFVGRLRKDPVDEKGLTLWCCGDQLRKGAATNAVQIAELLFGREE